MSEYNPYPNQQTPTGSVPVACPLCGEYFELSSQLREHLNTCPQAECYNPDEVFASVVGSAQMTSNEMEVEATSAAESISNEMDPAPEPSMQESAPAASEQVQTSLAREDNEDTNVVDLEEQEGDKNEKVIGESEHDSENPQVENTEQDQEIMCKFCDKSFETIGSLGVHVLRIHPFHCHYCWEDCSTPKLLRQHLKTHKKETPEECESSELPNNREVNEKGGDESDDDELKAEIAAEFKCLLCRKIFSAKTSLVSHSALNHPTYCYVCWQDCITKADRVKHIRLEHSWKCGLCCMSFRREQELLSHIDSHNDGKKRIQWNCHKCSRRMRTEAIMVRHAQQFPDHEVKEIVMSPRKVVYVKGKVMYEPVQRVYKSKKEQKYVKKSKRLKIKEEELEENWNHIMGDSKKIKMEGESYFRGAESNQEGGLTFNDVKAEIVADTKAYDVLDKCVAVEFGDTHPCLLCDSEFKTRDVLTVHTIFEHPQTCTVCWKTFKNKSYLMLHRNTAGKA